MTGRPRSDMLAFAAAAAELALADPPTDNSYSTRIFAQLSLPYRENKQEPNLWVRRNGHAMLTVQSGLTERDGQMVPIGLPFGILPRLILNYLCEQAIKFKTPEIKLGDSLVGFMGEIGQAASGGRTGTIGRIREQTMRLFKANVAVEWSGPPDVDMGAQFRIAKAWHVKWLGSERNAHPTLGKSTVTLSSDFYEEVIRHPVPLDIRALRLLSGSPMRLDLYTWLTYRMSTLERPVTLSWEKLKGQFGSDLADDAKGKHQFKRNFSAHLRLVQAVYRDANVEVTEKGLLLKPSRTHVPLRGVRALKALSQQQPAA